MKFIDIKTEGGCIKGKISMYCRVLCVSRQGFHNYLETKKKVWKYEKLVCMMKEIIAEDEYNDTYGRQRMYMALKLKAGDGVKIPSEGTVRKVMKQVGLLHQPKRKPNGITKADKEAMKSDDMIKRDFKADRPLEKCITDITEVPAKDGKLYISAIFDCFDAAVLGLSMADNMRAELCVQTLKNAFTSYSGLCGAVIHSDRGSQYTSEKYRTAISKYHIQQSMNSAGGRCHDNARCESMWARMKEELFYSRKRESNNYTISELKSMIFRYYMSYWNNRRICSANGGLPPMLKRRQYYFNCKLSA